MMDTSRTEILIGNEGIKKLRESTVLIVGLGGVGGYAAEAIVRAGVGNIIIADYDSVMPSNLNRQILSLHSNIGQKKCDIAAKRFKDINPDISIKTFTNRVSPENIHSLFEGISGCIYAIDAIDELDAKVSLISYLHQNQIPFVSSMGAGSKLKSLNIQVADISKTSHCPLARVLRKRLKEIGIEKGVRCIYSTENLNRFSEPEADTKKKSQGTISFMPGLFGLTAAGVIINDILIS